MGKVLIACEESQAVTKEFRLLGHEAFSCDILECSGGHPEWHLQQDVTELLKQKDERAKSRSKTFPGIAKALATQYTAFIKSGMTVAMWEEMLKGLDIYESNAIIDKYVQL